MALPVRTLDNVEFAPRWPDVVRILAIKPKRWPSATACGQMAKANDEKTFIVHRLRLYAHRAATVFKFHHAAVCSNVDMASIELRKTKLDCPGLVHVLHRAICRIPGSPEIPLRKKALVHVTV